MIIQCDRCNTRFRIADEKVTDRGVRVRCTRCENTFVVRRQSPSAASPPGGAPAPAASPGGAAAPGPGPAPNAAPAPGTSAGGPLAAGLAGGVASQAPENPLADFDLDAFEPALGGAAGGTAPAETAAVPGGSASGSAPAGGPGAGDTAAGGTAETGMGGLFDDLDLGDAGAGLGADPFGGDSPLPSAPTEADLDAALAGLEAFGPTEAPGTASPAPGDGPSGVGAAGGSAAAPAAEASTDPATGGGWQTGGIELDGAPEPDPDPPASSLVSGDPFPDDLFGDAASPPAAPAAPADRAAAPDPFTPPPAGGAPPVDPFGTGLDPFAGATGEADPLEGVDLFGGSPSAPSPAAAPPAAAGQESEEDPFAHLDLGGSEAVAASGAGPVGATPEDDDPFASLDLSEGLDTARFDYGEGVAAETEPAPEAPSAPVAAPADGGAVLGRIGVPAERKAAPAAEPALAAEEGEAPASRNIAAVVVNLLFGLGVLVVALMALVAYRTPGPVDLSLLSSARLSAAFRTPERPVLALESLSNGIYPVRGGGRLLYLRGSATNKGQRPATEVRVEGRVLGPRGEVLARAPGVLGRAPTPGELYEVEDADAARALMAQLESEGREQVAPGESVDFFVLFPEVPASLDGARFEVAFDVGDG